MRSLCRTITSLIIGLMFLMLLAESAWAYPLEEMSAVPPLAPLADDPSQPDEPVKLIFIHHSTGGNWLADETADQPSGGLGQALRENNYFVSATNYGWGPDSIGDRTDIPDWPEWFTGLNRDEIMTAVYTETGQNIGGFGDWTRMADPDPTRENEIIMFKSCFPNSDLYGDPDDPPLDEPNAQYTVANAKAVYNDILTYFATRQDKLFIVITAPPLMESETASDRAANARAFNNWLLNDWLDSYSHDNVAVFDYYNVLTSNGGDVNTNDYDARPVGNHHYWNDSGNEITHTQTVANNYSAYPSGDSHPTSAGHRKATAEFVDLLNVFYNRWQGSAPPASTLTLDAPNGGESWTVGSEQEIAWRSTGTIANVSLAYSTDGFGTSTVITSSTPSDGRYTWTVPDDPSTSVRVRVASVVSPTVVYDESDADFAIVSGVSTESYTFQAEITPSDATAPVTYAWSPEPDSGQGTARATYEWSPGSYDIAVAATNCGGTFTDTHSVTVGSTGAALRSERAPQATMSFQDGVSPSASYSGTVDTILASDVFTVNLGGLQRLETFLGGEGQDRRSLMSWDLLALPGDITINEAAVELYRFDGDAENPVELALYRVTHNWVEGTGNNFWPGSGYDSDGATWLTATTGVAWTEAGGDYHATAVGTTTLPAGLDDAWVHIEATAAVQDWISGEDDYGLLLRPLSGTGYHYFHSREAVTPTLRPRLVVTYTSGAPAPTLNITEPGDSTSWPVSSTQQIQWTTTGVITQVNLSYSLGDGFTLIESNVANVTGNNSYDWTTPPTATTSAQVRVQSSISATISDTSEAFSLVAAAEPSSTVYLPLVLGNYPYQPPSCPNPLTGVSIRGPITETPPAGDLVQPSDLNYLGAFRLPGGDTPPLTFAYGGNAMTFNPDGDSGAGSLFITGHDRQAWDGLPDGNQVAEVSIPTPAIESNLADLPQAAFLQTFHDATAGYFTRLEEIPKLGMAYLNHPDTGPLIHLCWGQHLQPPDEPSHAWFSANLAEPNLQGVWFIGDQNLYSTTGYMFGIPSDWADAHTEGRPLATGRMRDGGQGGMGPTIFAYQPWESGGTAPISGTRLHETTLLLYANVRETPDITRCLEGYQHPDEWEGGAWMTTPSGKSAVLFAGTKSNGAKYWYGFIHPDGPEYPCVDTDVTDFLTCRMADGSSCPAGDFEGCCDDEAGTCASQRGWWSTRWDAQLILYDPADLARVAAGMMESWEPQPYATLDIDEHLYLDPPEWDEMGVGWGNQRRYRIGAAAYDPQSGVLYVLEQFADGAKPVVHVWQVE